MRLDKSSLPRLRNQHNQQSTVRAPKDGKSQKRNRARHGRKQWYLILDMRPLILPPTPPHHHDSRSLKRSHRPIPSPKPPARRLHQPRLARHKLFRLHLIRLKKSPPNGAYSTSSSTTPASARSHIPVGPSISTLHKRHLARPCHPGFRSAAQGQSVVVPAWYTFPACSARSDYALTWVIPLMRRTTRPIGSVRRRSTCSWRSMRGSTERRGDQGVRILSGLRCDGSCGHAAGESGAGGADGRGERAWLAGYCGGEVKCGCWEVLAW